jgi:hypothetical protein
VIAHVGEIGKPQPARRVLLPEDNVLLGPVQRPPGTDAPLQGAANTDADLGMATPDLVENGHRPQAWGALQQRHYLAVPNLRQRIAGIELSKAATRTAREGRQAIKELMRAAVSSLPEIGHSAANIGRSAVAGAH